MSDAGMQASLYDESQIQVLEGMEAVHAALEFSKAMDVTESHAETESDLELVIEDNQTKIQSPAVGFSIKSQLGSASTLLNASNTS